MDESIFRKKSLERISSPDNLNDYIRVSNPAVWLVLVAIVVLLVGVCVWGFFGEVVSKVDCRVYCENGEVFCYTREEIIDEINVGMEVIIDDETGTIVSIESDSNHRHACMVEMQDGSLSEGEYEGEIVLKRMRPVSFIAN